MSMEIHYFDGCYCSVCDTVFLSNEARTAHLQNNTAHPHCKKCNRHFPDRHGLRSHYSLSYRHHYCLVCDRHFKSAAGVRAHYELSMAHRDVNDPWLPIMDESFKDWEESAGKKFFPNENARSRIPRKERAPALEEEIWFEDYELDYEQEEEMYQQIRPQPEEVTPDTSPEDKCLITDCSICSGPYDEQVSTTKCGHVFCTSCINNHLKGHTACPLCDRPTPTHSIRNLYLF